MRYVAPDDSVPEGMHRRDHTAERVSMEKKLLERGFCQVHGTKLQRGPDGSMFCPRCVAKAIRGDYQAQVEASSANVARSSRP